ncbi:MAG: 4Fe-4S dicluster domain-containing protein [Candidatus Helarchaeota archaeon]
MENLDYNLENEKKKIIPLMRKFAQYCTACGICIEKCVFHDYSRDDGKKIMREIKEFALSKKLDKKLSKKTKKFIWRCGICEHCNNYCPLPHEKKIPKAPFIVLLRGLLVVKNEAPFLVRFLKMTLFKDVNTPVLKKPKLKNALLSKKLEITPLKVLKSASSEAADTPTQSLIAYTAPFLSSKMLM